MYSFGERVGVNREMAVHPGTVAASQIGIDASLLFFFELSSAINWVARQPG